MPLCARTRKVVVPRKDFFFQGAGGQNSCEKEKDWTQRLFEKNTVKDTNFTQQYYTKKIRKDDGFFFPAENFP